VNDIPTPRPERPEDVARRLAAAGVDIVRISYPDLLGIDQGKDIPVDQLPQAVRHGLTFCRAVYYTTATGDTVDSAAGLRAGLPDIAVRPILDSAVGLPWEPGVSWMLGEAADAVGAPVAECPRRALQRVLGRFAADGLGPVIGPELEFYVLEPDPAAAVGWRRYGELAGNVYVVGRKGDPRGLLLRLLRDLGAMGLDVVGGNHEYCSGQFEVNLGHSAALDAAARAVRFKSAVREIALTEGLMATFMGRPFNDEGGSGFHLHVSMSDADGRNAFDDPGSEYGLSALARRALAGVLAHAPALSAFLAPTVNAYKRLGLHTLAPALVDWGLDNRCAMVRVPPERGAGTRLELRLGDATANPYLACAAALAAMYLGIKHGLEPPAPLEGYGYNPQNAAMLPRTLTEAVAAAEADTGLAEVLGPELVAAYLTMKRDELERFGRYVSAGGPSCGRRGR
jgi:glutamine synthetase